MILTLTNQEFQEMRMAVMDDDKDKALEYIKSRLAKQIEKSLQPH